MLPNSYKASSTLLFYLLLIRTKKQISTVSLAVLLYKINVPPSPQMPSAMVGNAAATSAIPDLGNGSHNETMKQIFNVIDKKVRNMEKKKVRSLHVIHLPLRYFV